MITKIITHKGCPDGIASAYILHQKFPNAEIQFVQHDTPEYKNIKPQPGLLFCDFSPEKNRAQEFLDAKTIVLDHHKTAQPIVELFAKEGLGIFGDEKTNPGMSGAMLAYHFINQLDNSWHGQEDTNLETIARLIGIRDTWVRNSPDWQEACELSSALIFYPFDYILSLSPQNLLNEAKTIGKILYNQKINYAKEAIKNSYRFQTETGYNVVVVSGTSVTSDVSDISDTDIVVGFNYFCVEETQKIILSFRSKSDFDVSKLVSKMGGGGHTKAAGCTLELNERSLQPYILIEEIFAI